MLTRLNQVYVFLGLVGVYFFLIFFNIGSQFLVNTAGFILPAYYSLDALFSAGKVDDTQVCNHLPIAPTHTGVFSSSNLDRLPMVWLSRGT